jgi:hypothetical protein
MKTILTLDKANKPYGFLQLDGYGNSTASFASSSISSSYASTSSFALNNQWTSNGGNIYYNGNVGINNNSPQNALDIIGDINIAKSGSQGLFGKVYNTGTDTAPENESEMTALILSAAFSNNVIATTLDNFNLNSRSQYVLTLEGFLNIPNDNTYTFALNSDDASDLFIDGIHIADFYGPHGFNGFSGHSGSIYLTQGYHSILARLSQGNGGDGIKVYYNTNGSESYIPIPTNWLKYGTFGGNITSNDWYINSNGTASFSEVNVSGDINYTGILSANTSSVSPNDTTNPVSWLPISCSGQIFYMPLYQ